MVQFCPTDFSLFGRGASSSQSSCPWNLLGRLQLRSGFYAQRSVEVLGRPASKYPRSGRALRQFVGLLLRAVPARPAVRQWLDCMSLDVHHNDALAKRLEDTIERWLQSARGEPAGNGIMMAISSLGAGGAERQMTQLALALAEQGRAVRVAVKHTGSPEFDAFKAELQGASIPIEPIPLRHDRADPSRDLPVLDCNLFSLVRGVTQLCEAHKPAVVHGWMDELGVAAGLAAAYSGVPRIVIDLRGFNPTWFDSRGLGSVRAAMRVLAKRSNVQFVSNSRAGANDYERWLGMRPLHALVIRNAIREDQLEAEPAHVAALRGRICPPEFKLIGGLMRFTWEKDPLLWVEAAADVCRTRDDVRFVLFGDGPLRRKVERRIFGLALDDRIALAGRIADRGAAFGAMDVLVVTSHIEGTPNVVLEAQCVGTPVVAAMVGGVEECIAPELRDFLVSSRTPAAFARSIIAAIEAHHSPSELHSFVAVEFSPQRQLAEYLRVYAG